MRLRGKLLITGEIEALTGLAIGGSKSDVTIGGIENNVIKNADGVPYIPGSSLKGKLRSLVEIKEGINKVCDCGESDCPICTIFGMGIPSSNEEKKENKAGPTRLIVRDAPLNETIKKQMEEKQGIFAELELTYTESKWENTIDRLTSKADNPRPQERVPAGSKFDFNIIYNILTEKDVEYFKYVIGAFRLLEDDYLGGNGSRGYGRVKFNKINITLKTLADYENGNQGHPIFTGKLVELNLKNVTDDISEFFEKGVK